MAEPYSEDRDETRFDHNSPLQVKDLGSGAIYEAKTQNYSNGGVYFESDGLFQNGTKIYICMKNSPYAQSSYSPVSLAIQQSPEHTFSESYRKLHSR